MSLDNEDLARLREIFVTRERCDDEMQSVNALRTDMELMKSSLKTIVWIGKTTLASLIGFIVVYIANLLFK